MSMNKVHAIKRAQRESLLYRTIARLFMQQAADDKELQGLSVTRVELNQDKSTCYVYFYSEEGSDHFYAAFEHLKLYKPSLRSALAKSVSSRYVPDLVFMFDAQMIKQIAIEKLLDSVKE